MYFYYIAVALSLTLFRKFAFDVDVDLHKNPGIQNVRHYKFLKQQVGCNVQNKFNSSNDYMIIFLDKLNVSTSTIYDKND